MADTLTSRERMEAALSPGGCGEFPVCICYEDIFYRDHLQSFGVPPWWHNLHPEKGRRIAWHKALVASTGQDWVNVPLFGFEADAWKPDPGYHLLLVNDQPVIEYLSDGSRKPILPPQGEGVEIVEAQNEYRTKQPIQSRRQLDELISLPKYSDQTFEDWQVQAHNGLLAEFPDLYKIGRVSSPLWQCAQLWGYEDYLAAVVEAPELLKYACERYLGILAGEVRQLKSLGVQAVWIEECFTDMIRADSFRHLNIPAVTQLIDEVRSQGLKSIYYFTGDPRRKLDMLLQTHPDALSLEEGKKGFPNDILQLAEAVAGKVTLVGNLDAVDILQNGTDEQLKVALAQQIRAGRKNQDRFIVGLGSPVTPDTPVQRTRDFCRMAHELVVEI